MKKNLMKLLELQNFFTVTRKNDDNISYKLRKSSSIILHNFYEAWLQSIWVKSSKHFPVFIDKEKIKPNKVPSGYIDTKKVDSNVNRTFEQNFNSYLPNTVTSLHFNLYIFQEEVMQYYLQWQRYRKYWWSSITTTPGLFSINDIKYGDNSADVKILSHFSWGSYPVETITMWKKESGIAELQCSTTLETGLITLLLDGLNHKEQEGYLKLHRKMAPYKISFALQYTDKSKKETLRELATLLHAKLCCCNISPWIPDFTLPLEDQITANIGIGVVYTAILSEQTLLDGIFHLLNSSTMLKEQVHVGDFESYAKMLFKN